MAEITLDQIEDWFNIHKTIHKIKIDAAATRGLGILPSGVDEKVFNSSKQNFIPSYRSSIGHGTDYAKEFQEQEEKELKELVSSPTSPGSFSLFQQSPFPTTSNLNQIEEDSLIAGVARLDEFVNDGSTENYKYFNFNHEYDPLLGITSYQEEIVSMIESNQVTVIQGATGCGKTTQVPQYILDYYAKRNYPCNIIVTQPRRIAAISIAKRVCHERQWELGHLIGYQVGLEKVATKDTRILYCTTGILLQRLINVKHMNDYTHIILDEVHERDQEMDFALLVVRKLLRLNSKAVKIVLMSATFEVGLFTKYFSIPVHGVLEPAPTITIKSQSFTVSEYYIEDLTKLGQIPEFNEDNPEISEFTYNLAARFVVEYLDKIEGDEQSDSKNGIQRGTVLIFLPGLEEINQMDKLLQVSADLNDLTILPLHSSITSEEQSRVFIPPKAGKRKIILGTNIGESSITVSDIKFVIDFCLLKNLVRDNETGFTSLALAWASKANCIQRKGRAGRVSAGRVYRMVTRSFYAQHLTDYGIPEMQRCPLEQLILQVKLLNLGEPKAILGLALQPPNLTDIERNVLLLKEASALTLHMNGKMNAHDGDLTFIGRVLASLPLDIHLGKLLVLGHIFGCLEQCLVIAASLSLKTTFANPFKQDLEAYRSKMAWADGSFSDCIAAYHAYRVWSTLKRSGSFHNLRSEAEWGYKQMIQHKRLFDVENLIKDLEQRLNKFNIRKPFQRNRIENISEDLFILKLVLCGSFYPNYFVQGRLDENEILRDLNGQDPMTSVVVSGIPSGQGCFYTSDIQELFKKYCQGTPSISFENTKAYLQFEKPRKPSSTKVHPSIYLAVKLRQLRMPLYLNLLPPEEVEKKFNEMSGQKEIFGESKFKPNRMDALCAKIEECNKTIPKALLPSLEQVSIQFITTVFIDAGHFWAQSFDPENASLLQDLQQNINEYAERLKPLNQAIQIGSYCLAPYKNQYYRGKIIGLVSRGAEIFFVDYGNIQNIECKNLRHLEPRHMMLPMQIFECFLSGLKPSVVKNHQGNWSIEAFNFVSQLSKKSQEPLYGQIHSIVDEQLYLEDVVVVTPQRTISIHNELIAKGYAVAMEDGLLSKKNYELRQACLKGEIKASDIPCIAAKNEDLKMLIDRKSIFCNDRLKKMSLRGPTTPLEISFQSLLRTGRMRSVRIERESVNSVSLEEEPQQHYARLMIASHVSVNSMGDNLVARNTTILPGIHGLPALMALIFSPTAELRTNAKKTHHTGVLCGLGYDPDTGQPLFPDHDMEVTFDTKIDYNDIIIINSIRSTFNTVLMTDLEVAQWEDSFVLNLQERARRLILRLWQNERQIIEPCYFNHPYKWGLTDKNYLYHHTSQGSENASVLFPLHYFAGVGDFADLDLEEPE